MKTLKYSGSFKKDLKRYKNNSKKIAELEKVLHFLEETGMVPMEYDPHYLKGNYAGCMECHIEDDYLLIWIDEKLDLIRLIRLGSHSELFN